MIAMAQAHGVPMRLVETAAASNDHRKRITARKVIGACGGVHGQTIAVLGLTIKPNTDDMRESPAISIITGLQDVRARIRAYDPEGMNQARTMITNVSYRLDAYDCAIDADAVVIVTERDVLRALDLDRLRAVMARPILVDLRNVYGPDRVEKAGFRYVGVGKGYADTGEQDRVVPLALAG